MRNGFTLIELLLVVVIIGILAALALPNFAGIQARAHKASMQSDLRNMATAEVLYLNTDPAPATVGDAPTVGFTPSSGNSIAATGTVSDWTLTATRSDIASSSNCSFNYGGASSANAVVCNF